MKSRKTMDNFVYYSLPPHGGSGLKFCHFYLQSQCARSPSTRREWIEITRASIIWGKASSPSTRREWIEIRHVLGAPALRQCLPPHGGSGLKCPACGFSGRGTCLPPHGGSGLKYRERRLNLRCRRSPSTRREWIEISILLRPAFHNRVSLHTEGVD